MEIICSAIVEDFESDVEAYWEANQDDLFIERDLEDLVKQKFDRLQELDPDAYKLLCRMGCYRYQDVPTVPIEGLFCLLWDVEEKRHRRVIKALGDRSLVECENNEYWLHPVIRFEAIARLRKTECWENVNQVIAEFWSHVVQRTQTKEEALRAFEAYHYYLEIEQFDDSSGVIMKRRHSKWHAVYEGESLHGAFMRLGMLNQISSACLGVVEKIDSKDVQSRLLFFIASDLRLMGYLQEAVKYSLRCVDLARRCSDKYLAYTQASGLSGGSLAPGE